MGVAPEGMGVDLDPGELRLPFPESDDDVVGGVVEQGDRHHPVGAGIGHPGLQVGLRHAEDGRQPGQQGRPPPGRDRPVEPDPPRRAGLGQHPPGPVEDAAPGRLHRDHPQPVRLRPGGIGRPFRHLEVDQAGQQRQKADAGHDPRHRHPSPPDPPRRRHPAGAPPPRPTHRDRLRPSRHRAGGGLRRRRGGPSGADKAATVAIRRRPGTPGNGTPPRPVATTTVARRPAPTPNPVTTTDRRAAVVPCRGARLCSPEDMADEGEGQRRGPERGGQEEVGARDRRRTRTPAPARGPRPTATATIPTSRTSGAACRRARCGATPACSTRMVRKAAPSGASPRIRTA